MSKKELSQHLQVILSKMCEFVGAKFEDLDIDKQGWYLAYEWTPQREEEFKTWLIKHMKGDNLARQQLMEHPLPTRSNLRRFAESFVFSYGWKLSLGK